ncbi:hypothetical protein [Entomomonas asaccharolytica]|uniref:Uncharacterized protein n=1 Tax=Entomomonas asaccharolytica TaxID=2785331 RepID=A0A974NDY3_9GAMM|nr:hypothetical protein [Entomomonas asaccharolytica]QQP85016.1 hypothetical protein JHT90_11545 [Entomomonas asaccharolytica]
MNRQPSNKPDKAFITKHSRHQYSGSTVIELYPSDFSVRTERYALALHPDTIITGGYFIVEEAFDSGTIKIGDDETADCYLAGTPLNTETVKPLLVTGKVTHVLNQIKLTLDAALSGDKGKAILIVDHVGVGKSNWTINNVNKE